jgi:hypothetical protein
MSGNATYINAHSIHGTSQWGQAVGWDSRYASTTPQTNLTQFYPGRVYNQVHPVIHRAAALCAIIAQLNPGTYSSCRPLSS